MKVTFIGHAAILVEAGGIRILSDPWWKGPCFGAQWWIYPSPDLESVRERPIDYIYISHGHNDHYHPGTLKTFSKETRILVSKDIDLASAVRELGFEVIELAPDQEFPLADSVTCRIWETCGEDTIMTISDGKEVCVNLNDAMHPYSRDIQDVHIEKLKALHPNIDYVFCGYGVASHFPNCYRVPGKDQNATAANRQHYFNAQWASIIHRLNPTFSFPFAAGVALLEEDLFWSNEPTHNAERPTDLFRKLHPHSPTTAIDIAPGFVIESHEIARDNRWQPLSGEKLRREDAELVERANRYGRVTQEQVTEVQKALEKNINKCADYLKSYEGDYRFLIRFRNSDIGLVITKTGSDIQTSTAPVSGADTDSYDLTYTTRLPYLTWSLTTDYGHEILFVGSGGIFDYPGPDHVPRNLHRELIVMMKRQDAPRAPRPHRSKLFLQLKGALKKLLGIHSDDLYDLAKWTVYK